MAWILLFIAIGTCIWGVINVKKRPNISLFFTALISFTTFYFIGKSGNYDVFIFFAFISSFVSYILWSLKLRLEQE